MGWETASAGLGSGSSGTRARDGASRRSARLESYSRWNDAIADVVFSSDNAGAPVYLDLEAAVLERIAAQAGVSVIDPRDALIEVVRSTLLRPDASGGMFGFHLVLIHEWRKQGDHRRPPPDLGLLAVLSLAAEDMRDGDGFAANNYYDRLMPLLGYRSQDDKARVIRAYRDCSAELWGALNGWLESLDGERGLPTAYARSHAHVDRALSQALVRATDRERLRELFVDLRLAPRTHMPARDLEVLIGEWMARSPCPATNAMQYLWASSDARARIVECAIQLLEAWDGVERTGPAAEGLRKLQLTALLGGFLKPGVELNMMGACDNDCLDDAELELDGPSGRPRLPVAPVPGGRWRLIEPAMLDPSSLLEGRLRLRLDSAAFERRPRQLVPMRRDDLLQHFVEVERLPLGEVCIVVCRHELAEAVADALGAIARPGFRREDALRGCPPSWSLFTSVQVLGELPECNPRTGQSWRVELNALQPLTSAQLSLTGGMRLPGRMRAYSTLAPPEVTVVAGSEGRVRIRLLGLREAGAGSTAEELRHETFPRTTAVLPVRPMGLPDGDYEVEASLVRPRDQLLLDRLRFRLRSSDRPPAASADGQALGRPMADRATAVLTATRAEAGPRLRGATLLDTTISAPSSPAAPPATQTPPWWDARASARPRPASSAPTIVVPAAPAEDCFHTGQHHMDLPTFYGRRQGQTVRGVCRRCGLVKRYPTRLSFAWSRAHGPAPPQRVPSPARQPLFDPIGVPALEAGGIDANVAFDALCHLGGGRIAALEHLSMQVEASGLYADRFARGLETLAHVELARGLASLEPVDWEVVPAALVELPSGSLVLVGHRSRRLVERLASACRDLGVELDRVAQLAAPDRIRVRGASLAQARSLAALAGATLHQDLCVVPDAARQVASVLPPLSSVIDRLARQPMAGARSVRRWDPRTARWLDVPDPQVPGAYKLSAARTLYALRDEQDVRAGTMRRVDARLVKHAAALGSGRSLLGYDERTRRLYMPLGAELPLLYGRAAALASGMLPEDDLTQGLASYQAVPADLAARLMAVLAS